MSRIISQRHVACINCGVTFEIYRYEGDKVFLLESGDPYRGLCPLCDHFNPEPLSGETHLMPLLKELAEIKRLLRQITGEKFIMKLKPRESRLETSARLENKND